MKIFVGGLPKDLTIEEFRGYFCKYGEIDDIAVISDKKTREPRGFGFVTFKTLESTRKVLGDYSKHFFRDKWVECKEAFPRPQNSESSDSRQYQESISSEHDSKRKEMANLKKSKKQQQKNNSPAKNTGNRKNFDDNEDDESSSSESDS